MHCIRCGKKGLFLRVNYAMLCKDCERKEDQERIQKQREQEDRKRAEAERQRREEAEERANAIEYYRSICQAYSKTTVYLPSHLLGIYGLTVSELQQKKEPYSFLIESLPKWSRYRFFYEIFIKDFEDGSPPYGYEKHRYFPVTRSRYNPSINIEETFSEIISRCQKNVGIYDKAIQDIERMSRAVSLSADNPINVNSLCLEYETQHVVGIKYRQKDLIQLALANPYYSFTKSVLINNNLVNETIWKQEFNPEIIELTPEPDNAHDKNAVKVIVDGTHIGYIKAEECLHILDLIKSNRIVSVSCEISGGQYKRVNEDYDIARDKELYYLDRGNKPYSAKLTIVKINEKHPKIAKNSDPASSDAK